MSMFGSLGGGSSYEMPDDYVAGDLAAPAELQRLRGSGATVLVEVVEGGAGAGVSCTDELVVDGIAPDSAAQQAGVAAVARRTVDVMLGAIDASPCYIAGDVW